jgi:hypothetical protein
MLRLGVDQEPLGAGPLGRSIQGKTRDYNRRDDSESTVRKVHGSAPFRGDRDRKGMPECFDSSSDHKVPRGGK